MVEHYSSWTNDRARKCCDQNGCRANTSFALKCLLKKSPYATMLTFIMVIGVACSYTMRIFERPYYSTYPAIGEDDESYLDYENYWNALWLIVVTTTTVGYGDFYCRSHLGRLISCCAAILGIFMISLFMVTLAGSTCMDP